MKNKGFTLIEWLFTISIIAILMISLILVLDVAGQQSRDSQRLGNIKAVQKAIEMYSLEHNALPPNDSWSHFNNALKEHLPGGIPSDPAGRLWCYCTQYYPSGDYTYLIATTLEKISNISGDLDELCYQSFDPYTGELGPGCSHLGDYDFREETNDCICSDNGKPSKIDCRDDANGGIFTDNIDNNHASTSCLGDIEHRLRWTL